MKINFNPKDKIYYGIEEIICPIVDIAIRKEIFVKFVCKLLIDFNIYDIALYGKIEKFLKLYKNLYIDDVGIINRYQRNTIY